MNLNSTTGNYFRTAAHVGVRQKVARRRAYDLPGGLLLWKAVAKAALFALPFVLAANLWCSSTVEAGRQEYVSSRQAVQQLEAQAEELALAQKRLLSPVRVKIAAAAKLSLYEPAPEQIRPM